MIVGLLAITSKSFGYQIGVIVVAAVIVGLLTWGARRIAKKEAARTQDMKALVIDVHEMKVALVGEQATLLNPDPPQGLIKNVKDLMQAAQANLAGTSALIKDKEPNDGSTSKDALTRIETATDSILSEQSRVASHEKNAQ